MSTLKKSATVVIIGGGVIGMAVARALALRGLRDVLLIERTSLGAEASSAAAGMLAPQAEADRADDFFWFTCQSRDMYSEFANSLRAETGIDIELDTTGTLYLAFTEDDVRELEHRYEWQTEAGLPVEQLDVATARAFEPCISPELRAALRFPRDMQVENRRLISALAVSNEQFGVQLETGTLVNSLRLDRGKLVGLETSRGFVATENVILAGGAWTSQLAVTDPNGAKISDKAMPTVRIEPVRGQMICFESNPRICSHVIYSPRGYLVPRRDGRLLAGSTTEHVGFDKRITADGVHSIMSAAREISPLVGPLPMTESWAGLRPRAADGLPVLGPCAEIEGLFYASGHYRNGILLAPITGELIAEALINKTISSTLKVFSPDRFNPVAASLISA
ncbi:MAG TPA: glycine oxidase ThiO [Pyrinomonadaceae bacterium]|nr:glycine oxidase ThiO [Pyrinomonadaceae bacterium]